MTDLSPGHPKVYLAHASEDKAMVRPIAEYLMAQGVDVWFDEWEIELGDSLREKMEAGLGDMTHFAVVLTPISVAKPWVAKEIDVGLVGLVGGKNRFIPVVVGVERSDLPLFIQTMLYLPLDPFSSSDLKSLSDRVHGVSRRPTLGPVPAHVLTPPPLSGRWSAAAIAVARLLVERSAHAMPRDPLMTLEEIASATNLLRDDVRIATLDLRDAGYIWEGRVDENVAPEPPLFCEFDPLFLGFDPSSDARTVANRMVTSNERATDTRELATALGWEPRRMNSAICYLVQIGAIEPRHALASDPWRAVHLIRTDETLRFAKRDS